MRHQSRTHRLRTSLIWLLIVVLVGSGAALAYVKIQATTVVLQPQAQYKNIPTKSSAALAWPDSGQAAVGIEGYGVLETHGEQKSAPTASVAKLITALSVLQKKPLGVGEAGPYMTIGATDVALYHSYVAQGGSVVPVNYGEQLSEHDALVALMLPSANNIADSLAIWTFGSLDAYATYANAWLKQQGFTETTVGTDASGLSPTTVSTAKDLAGIGMLAHNNPALAQIATMTSTTIPVAGIVKNVNWLLGVDGITGLKTGNSDEAGGAFVFTADVAVSKTKTVTIVGSVLQAPNLSTALARARTLVQSATSSTTYQQVVPANEVVGQYQLPRPHVASTAITSSAVSALYWRGKLLDTPHLSLNDITVPRNAGTTVGALTFGTDATQATRVILSDNLPQASWWYRLWH